ncbi:MAG: hypothetical protein G5663_03010 [Serratia symbiotica]|nr:hypothetical protein [Serratia symbiotica]
MYCLAQGGLFCGKSMFSHVNSAYKYVLIAIYRHFAAYSGELIDCQVLNAHTAHLGVSKMKFLSDRILTTANST